MPKVESLNTIPKLRTAGKVHVIDDDPNFCLILERMLSDLGYDVTAHTKSKSDVLSEMGASDILFVDMLMPGTNGLQVLEILASNQIKSAVVLMGSAADVLATAQAFGRLKGIQLIGILRKPFNNDQLIRVLEAS